MLRTATRRFRAAYIVHNTIMQGRGRAARGRSGRGGRGRQQQHMSSTTSSSDMNNSNKGADTNQYTRRTQQHKASGRGHHSTRGIPSQHTNRQNPINIETTNFQSIFHNKLCRAAKYKVHAPQCSCPKVVKLRQRYKNTQNKVKANNETATTTSDNIREYSNDQIIQFDIEGNITHQLSQLDITSTSNNDNKTPFDNLIVLPDTKGANPSIYSCTNTNLQSFQKDGIECEQKLALEIFGNTSTATTTDKVASTNKKKIPPFKVNCAICLLTTHQRNGFVAIISNSINELQSTITSARKSTLMKQSNGEKLHADHAHFICAIKLSSLYSLLSAGKTRSKNEMVTKDILMQIRNDGGVDCLSSEMTNESTSSVQIKMGHHLTSLLWLLQDDKQQKSSSNSVKYIMVMGYIDSPNAIELDLPGGKRHLGETTLQGVIREVEEECSLQIDYDWLDSHVSKRYGGSRDKKEDGGSIQVLEPRKVKGSVSGDAFFVMTPPPPVIK